MADNIKKGKSKSSKSSNDDFEDFDMGDFDDLNFDNEISGDSRQPAKQGIGKEFLAGAKDGFKKDVINQMAKKALPDEFETYSSELSDLSSFASDTLDKSKSKLKKPLARMAKETKKYIPESLTTINKWMDKIIENTDEIKAQQINEEEARTTQITGALGSIFDKQLEAQKALSARTEAIGDTDRKVNLTNVKRTQDLLNDISASTSTNTSFNLQIAKEYYKKSLELQFRSYYIQADTLKSIKEYYPIYKTQFDAIIKNSGLPDYVKIKTDEKYYEIARTQMMQGINQKLMSNNKFMQNVKKNIATAVDNKINDLADKMDNVADAMSGVNDLSEMNQGSSKAGTVANLLGSIGGSNFAEFIGKKFGDKFKPLLENSTTVNVAKNQLATMGKSPQVFIANLMNMLKDSNEGFENNKGGGKGFLNGLKNMLGKGATGLAINGLDVARQTSQDTSLNKESILTTKTPAVFDQMVYRSITHVIPLYLAHILKENKRSADVITKGKDSGEVMEYDYNSRKLSTKADTQKNYSKFLEEKSIGNRTKDTSSRIIDTLNVSGNQKKEMSKTLEDYIREVTAALPASELTYDNLFGDTDNAEIKKIRDAHGKMDEVFKEINKANKKNKGNKDTIKERVSNLTGAGANKEIRALFNLVLNMSVKLEIELGKSSLKKINLSEEEATAINFSFSRYILDENRALTVKNLSEAFKYVVNNELLIKKIVVLLSIVKAIDNRTELAFKVNYIGQITVILADINTKIINSVAADHDLYRAIFNVNPGIFDFDKISSNNLINISFGKIENSDSNTDFKGKLDRKNGLRVSDDIVAISTGNTLEKITKDSLSAKLVDGKNLAKKAFTEMKTVINNASNVAKQIKDASGNPQLQAKILKTSMDNLASSIYATTRDVKAKALKSLDGIKNTLTDFTEQGKLKLVSKLDENIASIEELIKTNQSAMEQTSTIETELTEGINNETNSNVKVESVQTAFMNAEIKALNLTLEELKKIRSTVASLDFKNKLDKATLKREYEKVRGVISKALLKMKEYSETFKEARQKTIEAQNSITQELATAAT